MRREACGRAVAGCAAALALAGCTGTVPYAPGPSVVPSPSPVAVTAAPPPAVLDLSGDVRTADGLRFHVHSDLRFGAATSDLPDPGTAPVGWTAVHVAVTGSSTVTNTSDRPNEAAATAVFTFVGAYPLTSTVCRRPPASSWTPRVAGGRCWRLLGTSTPYSYRVGEPMQRLAPGASRTGDFALLPIPSAEAVDAPVADYDTVVEQVRHPADVVVLATASAGDPRVGFSGGCRDGEQDPPADRFVIVGASSPLRCRDVPLPY